MEMMNGRKVEDSIQNRMILDGAVREAVKEWKMLNNECLTRSVRYILAVSVALAFAPVQAQQALGGVVVDELAPEESIRDEPKPYEDIEDIITAKEELPPWRDLRPREFTSMLFALSFAAADIPNLDQWDKAKLSAAAGRLSGLNSRAAQYIDQACWDVLSGKFAGQEGSREVAGLLVKGDQMQAEDVRLFFEYVVDSLSEEGRKAVIGYTEEVSRNNTTANWTDWQTYAELAPEEMLEAVTKNCENRFGVERR